MNELMFVRVLCGGSGADALEASCSIIQRRCLILFSAPIYWKDFFIIIYNDFNVQTRTTRFIF